MVFCLTQRKSGRRALYFICSFKKEAPFCFFFDRRKTVVEIIGTPYRSQNVTLFTLLYYYIYQNFGVDIFKINL